MLKEFEQCLFRAASMGVHHGDQPYKPFQSSPLSYPIASNISIALASHGSTEKTCRIRLQCDGFRNQQLNSGMFLETFP